MEIKDIHVLIGAMMDKVAVDGGYPNMETACLCAPLNYLAYKDSCLGMSYKVIEEIEKGTRKMPTDAEFMSLIASLSLPVNPTKERLEKLELAQIFTTDKLTEAGIITASESIIRTK